MRQSFRRGGGEHPGDEGQPGGRRRRWGWGSSGSSENGASGQASNTSARLDAILGALQLSARQKEEADAVFSRLRDACGASLERLASLDTLLAAIGSDAFDKARAEAAIAGVADPEQRKELLDGFEHLHNILLPEQRQQLLRHVRL